MILNRRQSGFVLEQVFLSKQSTVLYFLQLAFHVGQSVGFSELSKFSVFFAVLFRVVLFVLFRVYQSWWIFFSRLNCLYIFQKSANQGKSVLNIFENCHVTNTI